MLAGQEFTLLAGLFYLCRVFAFDLGVLVEMEHVGPFLLPPMKSGACPDGVALALGIAPEG